MSRFATFATGPNRLLVKIGILDRRSKFKKKIMAVPYIDGDPWAGAHRIAHSFGRDLRPSPQAQDVIRKVRDFILMEVVPAEKEILKEMQSTCKSYADRFNFHSHTLERLKASAKKKGLWNLFLPTVSTLTNLEYAYCAELMGRYLYASEAMNCSAPDTGNMETLHLYANAEQKVQLLLMYLFGTKV